MSDDQAIEVEERFAQWDNKKAKHAFIARMEKKLHRKEHMSR
jgi:hypothetical protein